MAEELDLELDEEQDNINRVEKRIKSLSDKVKLSSEERDAATKAREEEATARASAEKERDFFKGFNQVSAKYQGANEYQDKIWEKVKSGYDVEDATVAILNKEGKLTPNQPKVEVARAGGGSAATAMTGSDTKSPNEMTQDELRTSLRELELKGELHL